MKSAITLLALLTSVPAMGQHYTNCISSDYVHDHWAQCAQEREEREAAHRLNAKPMPADQNHVCIVVHQTGVVRNAAPDEAARGMIVDCELTDDNALNYYLAHGGH